MARYLGPNRIFIPALPGIDIDGEQHLSVAAQHRADRAAQGYFDSNFEGTILIAGGFNMDVPPTQRGAHLMARYLMQQYHMAETAILTEDESATPREHYQFGVIRHPEFFNNYDRGKRKIAIASHPEHLEAMVSAGSEVLQRPGHWSSPLPTWQPDREIDRRTVSRYAHLAKLAIGEAVEVADLEVELSAAAEQAA